MKYFLTLSTLILSFATHAEATERLRTTCKVILGECYYSEWSKGCLQHDFTATNTNEPNKFCCIKYVDMKPLEPSTALTTEPPLNNSPQSSPQAASPTNLDETSDEVTTVAATTAQINVSGNSSDPVSANYKSATSDETREQRFVDQESEKIRPSARGSIETKTTLYYRNHYPAAPKKYKKPKIIFSSHKARSTASTGPISEASISPAETEAHTNPSTEPITTKAPTDTPTEPPTEPITTEAPTEPLTEAVTTETYTLLPTEHPTYQPSQPRVFPPSRPVYPKETTTIESHKYKKPSENKHAFRMENEDEDQPEEETLTENMPVDRNETANADKIEYTAEDGEEDQTIDDEENFENEVATNNNGSNVQIIEGDDEKTTNTTVSFNDDDLNESDKPDMNSDDSNLLSGTENNSNATETTPTVNFESDNISAKNSTASEGFDPLQNKTENAAPLKPDTKATRKKNSKKSRRKNKSSDKKLIRLQAPRAGKFGVL